KHINSFDYNGKKIEVLNGMYGAYMKYSSRNYRIPKGGKDATDMTLEDCVAIIEEKFADRKKPADKEPAKKAATKRVKKAPAKKKITKAKK
ncbi:DNA topoisomerase I, partial [Patescibacteria group bacterium]|nr:DNA topoisomerase I [Patescibacteria group bacterium]